VSCRHNADFSRPAKEKIREKLGHLSTEPLFFRAPDAAQVLRAGLDFTLHGVVFAIFVQALPCTAEGRYVGSGTRDR
jgi:hypothetical protein